MYSEPWKSNYPTLFILHWKHVSYWQKIDNETVLIILAGASLNAFTLPVVWLTSFLTSCTAVLPSITRRALNVILVNPSKHKVMGLLSRILSKIFIIRYNKVFVLLTLIGSFSKGASWATIMDQEQLSSTFVLTKVLEALRNLLWMRQEG